MTTDLSLTAEHECVSHYACLIREDVETKYSGITNIARSVYWFNFYNDLYNSSFWWVK